MLLLFAIAISVIPGVATANSTPTAVDMEGELVCLPHQDRTGSQTLECIFGLRSKDGQYFGLKNLNQEDIISGKVAVGRWVHVSGILTPGAMEPYDMVGMIEVQSIILTNR